MDFEALAMEGGFARPVLEAQSAFRALMDALARPGTSMAGFPVPGPPAPLSPEAGAVALALCDPDTPIWLDAAMREENAVAAWLGFHTGAPIVAHAAEAHFAFVADPGDLIGLENFAQGSQDYPDRSATLVLQVASLEGGPALRLAGPGIETERAIAPRPLPRHFARQWEQNNARFPRGIDVLLVCREGLIGLPRTVRIHQQEG
ncbi:phosphonate C-P lyase system protein PhnH [Nitratireductor luteus]|uniref:phosphonate C-P lyase system protein PhnH n=1 Tax=Nitratireductor luteus TaxID=2976980 RepID=UPI00223F40F3|nr:phosphonate C-P lyase system protein PhnH [Nitratireductor luteus]